MAGASSSTSPRRRGVKLAFSIVLLYCLCCCLVFPTEAATAVTHLPGFDGPLPFPMETGYVNVNEEQGVELFYYFFESESDPLHDPVILWLTGGPGCSGFSSIAFQIGPVSFVVNPYNNSLPQLEYKQYTWTKMANIIFLDSPVGTGFSYAQNKDGYNTGDISSSLQVHRFILKWFVEHPRYLTNPFYVAGDSYAAKVVPFITQKVMEGLEMGMVPLVNLEGYMVGNPFTNDDFDQWYRIPFAHGTGIISDQLYELIEKSCEGETSFSNPRNPICAEAVEAATELISYVSPGNILEEHCIFGLNQVGEYLKLKSPPDPPALSCRTYAYYLCYFWMNNTAVRGALGMRKNSIGEWQRCVHGLPYESDIDNPIKFHLNVTSHGVRALVYSGDHDMIVPTLGTEAWVRALNFSIVDDWRPWHAKGKVGGFAITYSNNMTFATVRGAGHTAAEYRPMESYELVRMWLANEALTSPQNSGSIVQHPVSSRSWRM